MKKISLLSVLLLLTTLVNGQVNKLSIGIKGSPDFYNYQFKDDIWGFGKEDKTKINYSLGPSVNYNISEKFSIMTGLLYATKGYILNYHFNLFDPNDPAFPNKSNINVSYLDIPLLISYDFIDQDKLSIFASTGVVSSFLIKEKEISTMGNGSVKETKYSRPPFNKLLFAIDLGLGLKYNLSEKLFISIVPYWRYGLNKLNDKILESNQTSTGANFGFFFNL